jgi:hypothetical protein
MWALSLWKKASVEPYQGGFLLHYHDKLVHPYTSASVLTVAGVIVLRLQLRALWVENTASIRA